jgi:hypothetical protein
VWTSDWPKVSHNMVVWLDHYFLEGNVEIRLYHRYGHQAKMSLYERDAVMLCPCRSSFMVFFLWHKQRKRPTRLVHTCRELIAFMENKGMLLYFLMDPPVLSSLLTIDFTHTQCPFRCLPLMTRNALFLLLHWLLRVPQ